MGTETRADGKIYSKKFLCNTSVKSEVTKYVLNNDLFAVAFYLTVSYYWTRFPLQYLTH